MKNLPKRAKKKDEYSAARPFLKWAGGKTQLIKMIDPVLPSAILNNGSFTYIEPFVGSGAVLFHVLKNHFNKIESVVINDSNDDLISTYRYLKSDPEKLISELKKHKENYYSYQSDADRRKFFYEQRDLYNSSTQSSIEKAALLMFINKTCYNGLFRVNSKNRFNVPYGRHKKPAIYDEDLLLADSRLLQKVTIIQGDFEETLNHAGDNTLFYFDPPYKPISTTSSFNSYSSYCFDDEEQVRLKRFCDKLTQAECFFILSNSDPKNIDPANTFFDDLYRDYKIDRVPAKRLINSSSGNRGRITELLITNENHFPEW